MASILDLPPEILVLVLSHLPVRELLSIHLVNKHFLQLSRSNRKFLAHLLETRALEVMRLHRDTSRRSAEQDFEVISKALARRFFLEPSLPILQGSEDPMREFGLPQTVRLRSIYPFIDLQATIWDEMGLLDRADPYERLRVAKIEREAALRLSAVA